MNKNININWSITIVSILQSMGVKYACISPGARNSALTYAFSECVGIKCYSHIDERSAAFFALGLAKLSKEPTILICTSGTAGANYLPASIEASSSRIPLIILTADRPPNLVNSGSNQTINQKNLFGEFVRFFFDIGLPQDNVDTLSDIIECSYNHAKGSELESPPGPVHLNLPFDEPLLPDVIGDYIKYDKILSNQLSIKNNLSFPILEKFENPLIIIGPFEENIYQDEIIKLANKLNAPILADPLSQLRYGFEDEIILSNYDYFLKYNKIEPDLIIRFGRKPTSKVLFNLLEEHNDNVLLIDQWSQFNDDSRFFIKVDIKNYCLTQIEKCNCSGSLDWKKKLIKLENIVSQIIINESEYSEGTIARGIIDSLNDNDCLIIGNSMPIRDVDMYSQTSKTKLFTFANRGASGIDGVLSTALGISSNYSKGESILLIGDISFFHDIGGLLSINYVQKLTIIIINNSGGGIFSFLPLSKIGLDHFEDYWTTSRDIDIKKIAKIYNCSYFSTNTINELQKNIKDSFLIRGTKIIELKVEIDSNVKVHNNVLNKVSDIFSKD